MDTSQWKRARELFDAAVELPLYARRAYVEANCPDPELRQLVEQLLHSHQSAGEFLEQPVPGAREEFAQLIAPSLFKDRYRILEKIGAGGFGDVYLAADQQLAERKVIVKSLRQSSEWLDTRFQQEMEALARIDHPGVAAVFDTGVAPHGNPFLVMQYVPGPTLRQAMPVGPMPFARLAALAAKIAAALDAAHAAGVLHRDLKPENIILRDADTPREAPVLIDFGIARVGPAPGHTTTHVAGSPLYMAPEQLLGRAVPKSDQYALALILFELLTGSPLYQVEAGDSPEQAAAIALRDQPKAVREAMTRALSFDPSRRFPSAFDFAAALAPPSRRHFGLFGVGALALAAAYFVLRPSPAVTSELLYTVTRQSPAGEVAVDPASAVFHAGDKIRLRFAPAQPGYLYLLNEAAGSTARTPRFILLQASTAPSKDAVTIPSSSNWIEFDSDKGTERLWVLWSHQPIPTLAALRPFMNPQAKGEITAPAAAQALVYDLEKWQRSAVPPIYQATLNAGLLRTETNQIVAKIELIHE